MPKRALLLVVLLSLLSSQSGCALIEPTRNFTRQSWRLLRPKPYDYRVTAEEFDDRWSQLEREGRADRPLEDSGDPLDRVLMSAKARSIQRGVGIR